MITANDAWELGLWAMGLISMGWFEMALVLLTGAWWPSLSVTFLLLVLAAFGGGLAPYMPFAQWIAALHNVPGTLGFGGGFLYLTLWAVLSAGTVLYGARYLARGC